MQSDRLGRLPPYLFVEIDRLKKNHASLGREVFDLGIGDPDTGAPADLVRSLKKALDEPRFHRYPPDTGLPRLKEAIINSVADRFGIDLLQDEVLVTIGSKEAIGHLPLATVNPEEVVLVPDPAYPVYNSSAVFAGAFVHRMPLLESAAYWPQFEDIDDVVTDKAKLLYLNYPNNPTSATAGRERFQDAVEYCGKNGIVLANDAAYFELSYGEPAEPLFPIARNAGIPYIELFSFSKALSITGWRIGYAIGSRDVISALSRLKGNIDSGVFGAIQEAVAVVLETCYQDLRDEIVSLYLKRRAILAEGLGRGGFEFSMPKATFYFWVKVPGKGDSLKFCEQLIERTGIVCTPGIGFGPNGEGYFRLSLTADTDIIRSAAERFSEYASEL